MSFLLDTCFTCFVSEFTRRRADDGVVRWLAEQDESGLYLSAVTVGELEQGLARVRDPARQKRLRSFVELRREPDA